MKLTKTNSKFPHWGLGGLITILLITTTLITNAQSTIKTYIDQNLTNQGNKGITGTKLKNVLNATVDWVDSAKISTAAQTIEERNTQTVYTVINSANTQSTPYILNKKFEEIELTYEGPFWYAIDTIAKPIDVLMYTSGGNFGNLVGRTNINQTVFTQTPMPGSTFTTPITFSTETTVYTSYRDYFGFNISLSSNSPVRYRQTYKLNYRALFDNFAPTRLALGAIGNSSGTQSTTLESISSINTLVFTSNLPANTVTITGLNPWMTYRFVNASLTVTHTIIFPSTIYGQPNSTIYLVPYSQTTLTTPAGQTFRGTFSIRRASGSSQICVVTP